MPSNQKLVATHTFTEGVDTVTDRTLLPPTKARYMLNCVVLSSASGNVGIVTNIKGNTLVQNTLPDGRCKMIGWTPDEEADKFYYFVWNANRYHTIYRYDGLLNRIDVVAQNITDTGGLDVFKWNEEDLILMADVVQNNLLYWVKGGNDASKLNIDKAMDKSSSGYGVITEDVINAYKLAPISAPVTSYYSDTTVNVNRWYGVLAKFACRFIYDDGEISNWSDYSNAAVPPKESFTGVNFIPTDNNAQRVVVPTGSKLVKQIEIAMQYTMPDGFSSWVSIVTLDKEKLTIGDNSEYVYTFYNDGQYSPVDPEKIIRPYSFLPKQPLVQAFTKNAMVYGNFYEGFEDVTIDMAFDDVIYENIFLDDSVENRLSEAEILVQVTGDPYDDYMGGPTPITYVNGTTGITPGVTRARKYKLTIGSEVVAGNTFNVQFANGFDNITYSYTATITDTAESVANKIKNFLIGTGKLYKTTPDLGTVNIYDNDNVGGDISFTFIIFASVKKQYLEAYYSVNQVNISTLKDTGQSIPNMKLGASTKFGIMYEDFQGRRSLVYTDVKLIVTTDTQNDLGGIKKVKLVLSINHKPPVWAKWYQIVRTDDLTYQNFLQMIIQKVTEVASTDASTGEYLDLTIGSLFTYQKIHPNTVLKYNYTKGDRIRFISQADGDYYDFFEAEILEYNEVVTADIDQNVKTDGTADVEVNESDADNIGKYIIIDGNEREIIASADSTHYTLSAPIGSSTAETYLSYTIVDRRGSIRIRKPAIDIEDNSLVELFTPSFSTDLNNKEFYHFNKKFEIVDAGLETRQHFGDLQIQTDAQPAKVSITEGTVYVRSREMPVTNNVPAQVVIKTIEDDGYSDFYFSQIDGNGKTNIEDNGAGVVHFGERLRFSNNYIEDTKINGLNDFDNLDRKDYNDKYGDFMRIVFTEQQLLAFKKLKVGIVPIYQTIITDNSNVELLGTSSKLLNEIRYYSHQGGIGDTPEAYCMNDAQHYYVSVNEGIVVRLGGDGATPISEIYYLDNLMREILADAYRNNANIFLEWDVDISALITAISNYEVFTFNSVFSEANWKILSDAPPSDALAEILTQPTHGEVTLAGKMATVVEDYLGKDSFTYRVLINGFWRERKVCITYKDLPNRQTAWRPRFTDAECELEEEENTGNLIFITLEQYYIDDSSATGVTKPNTVGDPDYVPYIQDLTTCPVEGDIYYSAEYTEYATRNNCVLPDVAGPAVPFTAPEGMFTSVVDQETADQKAIDYVQAGKQANANSIGTCVTPPPSFTNDYRAVTFYRNNCGGGQVGGPWVVSVAAGTYTASSKALANAAADSYIAANGQSIANTYGTCTTPTSFTFQVVIYGDYRDVRYDPADVRGVSFEFANGSGYSNVFATKLVSTTVSRNATVHTYSVSFSGPTIGINAVKCYLTTSSTSTAGSFPSTLKHNGSTVGTNTNTISGGIPTNTLYILTVATAISTTLSSSSVLRLEHGTPSGPSCDLYVAFSGKTDETFTGANDGTITVTSGSSFGGGYMLSKNGGASYPYAGVSPYTFTGLAPGTYTIVGINADGSCGNSIAPVTILSPVPSCDLVLSFSGKTDETSTGANNGTITVTGSTSHVGGFVLSKDGGATYPFIGTSPYVFTGLAPGVYSIYARNADGSCGVFISPVTINAAAPSCDLSISFSGKTDETSAGLNDGTITITGSTSFGGGFVLSKDNGATFPFTGTSPYVFTGLAPGIYNIKARNANGTCTTSISAVTINSATPPEDSLFLSINNATTGTDATITSGSLGAESLSLSLVSGGSVSDSPLDYTTTPINVSIGISFGSGASAAYYYAQFYKNGVSQGIRSYNKSTSGAGSTTITFTGMSVAVNDEISIALTFEPYSELGYVTWGEENLESSGEACAVTMGDQVLFSSSTDGTLEVGDRALIFDASLYGKLVPVFAYPSNNYISYEIGSVRYWATVNTSTGEVLTKGVCSGVCDLEIDFVSKTDESSTGANDGSITISGSTSYFDGFKLSINGGSSYPFTGTSPYTFLGLAPGTYSIAAINADGTCETALSSAIVINPADAPDLPNRIMKGSFGRSLPPYIIKDSYFINVSGIDGCNIASTLVIKIQFYNVNGLPGSPNPIVDFVLSPPTVCNFGYVVIINGTGGVSGINASTSAVILEVTVQSTGLTYDGSFNYNFIP